MEPEKEQESHEENQKSQEEEKNEENNEEKKEENKDKPEEDEKEEEKEKEEKEKENKKEKSKKKAKKEDMNLILAIDEENYICVDCEEKYPTKISINNGVIICEECAKKHASLGSSISYIKDIEDDLDEYLLNFLVFGSNSKFKRFLTSEKVDPSLPIEKKYLTKACYFYRKNLKKKVKGENAETKKDYEDPNEIVEQAENDFPEFENYKIKSKVIHEGALKTKTNTKLNAIGGSILSLGKKMFGGIKYGANYVVKKTEGPSKNIIKGAGFVGKKIGNAYEKIKSNFIKGKNHKEHKEKNVKVEPPNLDDNNLVETKRPLQAKEEEPKEEEKKEDNEIVENKEGKVDDQQIQNNNEEKIDAE